MKVKIISVGFDDTADVAERKINEWLANNSHLNIIKILVNTTIGSNPDLVTWSKSMIPFLNYTLTIFYEGEEKCMKN